MNPIVNDFGIATSLPLVDLVLYQDKEPGLLPHSIQTNETIQAESEFRRKLALSIDTVFKSVPHGLSVSIPEHVSNGTLGENLVIDLYNDLHSFLVSDPYNKRLVLYMPFELLPDTTWIPSSLELEMAVEHFVNAYLEKWNVLLTVYDIRANFVDGNLIDQEHQAGNSPRVSKAAHLIPHLVSKGILSVQNDVFRIFEAHTNPTLRSSIADAIEELGEMQLLSSDDISYMKTSDDRLLQLLAILATTPKKPETQKNLGASLEDICACIIRDIEKLVESTYPNGTVKSESRLVWEQKQHIAETLEYYSTELYESIQTGSICTDGVLELMRYNASPYCVSAGIIGLGKLFNSFTGDDLETALVLAQHMLHVFEAIYPTGTPVVQDVIEVTYNQLYNLGLLKESHVDWARFYPKRLEERMTLENLGIQSEKARIEKFISEGIAKGELQTYIFPIVVLYGSRVKGYAAATADSDIAVFIKPNIPFAKRAHIQDLLCTELEKYGLPKQVLEFWLTQQDDELKIQDFDLEETFLGESTFTQVLFHGLWIGEHKIMSMVSQNLIPYYFAGNPYRSTWLEELERNTLQYRLMHRGYNRYYSPQDRTRPSHYIDGHSTFWDSGYRILATKLFIEKVYVPRM